MQLEHVIDTPAFLEARRIVDAELPDFMRTWTLAMTIEMVLRRIQSYDDQRPVRGFSRHVLKLSGNQHARVSRWLRDPSLLTVEDACIVLRALANEEALTTPREPPVDETTPSPLARKLVAHTITTLNSVDMLTSGAISPADLFDGDRMHIRGVMERLCGRFGIHATFSDPSAKRNQRMHANDLDF